MHFPHLLLQSLSLSLSLHLCFFNAPKPQNPVTPLHDSHVLRLPNSSIERIPRSPHHIHITPGKNLQSPRFSRLRLSVNRSFPPSPFKKTTEGKKEKSHFCFLTAMTEVLVHSPSSSLSCTPSPNPAPASPHAQTHGAFETESPFFAFHSGSLPSCLGEEREGKGGKEEQDEEEEQEPACSSSSPSACFSVAVEEDRVNSNHNRDRQPLSLLALLVALLRKSLIACKGDREALAMEIGWPTNVRHVAHVTFDRFNGFLGLPVELEPEVPSGAPSASANVFGVSAESMQLSYDRRGNSVPTILLMLQNCLYAQGGLQAEGIFRINAENSQEEYVRDQLNHGNVPEGIDVHCLAGLIKAWFRELPDGVLDSLSQEQVMQCQSDEDCFELVRLLPLTEAALLDWAVNLMADVVQQQHLNKMNARNIAMVFAPNMTKMADPLTALMYAVQVMNFLKILIMKALESREDSMVDPAPPGLDPSNDSEHQNLAVQAAFIKENGEEIEKSLIPKRPFPGSPPNSNQDSDVADGGSQHFFTPSESLIPDGEGFSEAQVESVIKETKGAHRFDQSVGSNLKKDVRNLNGPVDGVSNLSRVNLTAERIEAWW